MEANEILSNPLKETVSALRRALWQENPLFWFSEHWEAVVGPQLSSLCWVSALRDGVLYIGCDSASLACELQHNEGLFLARLQHLQVPKVPRAIYARMDAKRSE